MIGQKRCKTNGSPPQLLVEKSTGDWMVIRDSKHSRILGATLQKIFSWQGHLETAERAVLPEARRKLGALQTLKTKLPQQSRLQLATSLVISKLVYLIPLWGGGATQKYVNNAKILMNKAARFVTNLPKRTRIRTLLDKCNWLSVREMIDYHSMHIGRN